MSHHDERASRKECLSKRGQSKNVLMDLDKHAHTLQKKLMEQ